MEEVKWVDGKHRNNLELLIRNSSQCFWMFLTSLYHRFGCLLAFLMLWTQNGLFLMVIFLLNSIKPALDGLLTIRMSTRKSRKNIVKNIYTLNKCEYAQFIRYFQKEVLNICIFKVKLFFNKYQEYSYI